MGHKEYKEHKDSYVVLGLVGRKNLFLPLWTVISRPAVKSRAELYTLTFTLTLHSHLHIYHLAAFCTYKNRRSKNSSAVTHFRTSFFSFDIINCTFFSYTNWGPLHTCICSSCTLLSVHCGHPAQHSGSVCPPSFLYRLTSHQSA